MRLVTGGLGEGHLMTGGLAAGLLAGAAMPIITRGLGFGGLLTRGLGIPSQGSEPEVPYDLVDAVVARLQAALVATGPLTWLGTGLAPPETDLPYAEIGEPEDEAEYQSEGEDGWAPYDDRTTIPISIFAPTAKGAKDLANLVEKSLNDAPLTFLAGELLYLRRAARANPALDPDPAPDGGDCWSVPMTFMAITSKTT